MVNVSINFRIIIFFLLILGEKNRDNHRDNYDSSDDSDFADMIEPNAFDKTIGHIEDLLIGTYFKLWLSVTVY